MKSLGDFSLTEANNLLAESKRVICPICAPEPVQNLSLNICEIITKKIAEKISEKTGIYQTSPILQGIITPFKPVADIGLHKNRFRAIISDCVCSLSSAGAKKIFFITSSDIFTSSIQKAIKDYKSKLPTDFSAEIIYWQNTDCAQKKTGEHFENLSQFWRNEAAIFLLANELAGIEIPKSTPNLSFSKEDFVKWKKRGMDPEKLRKLSPNFQFSQWTNFTPMNASFFEELCNEITKKIANVGVGSARPAKTISDNLGGQTPPLQKNKPHHL
ncbi:MAG: hypothetical protein FWE23_04645 [Chitinivibrionia bacterium]|nr:hypothetical protein [Chitinivibrionia bacterium]